MPDFAIPELIDQWTTDWEESMSERTERMMSSIIREILKFTMQPEIISFAGGLPAPELFPVQEFKEACIQVLESSGEKALQYSTTEGHPPLREHLAATMQKYGVPATLSNTLITSGSQQALDLIGRLFLDKGDKILVDAPTYLGAIQAWRSYGPHFVAVPQDERGMDPDLVERALKEHEIKFIYILPNFHNPAGTTLPYERRERLVELAANHGAFIIEDDPYGELRYEGEDVAPLVSLHKENVIYTSTFSKTLAPGLRLGWIVAPQRVISKLVFAKQAVDLHTGTFIQYVTHYLADRKIIKNHVKHLRAAYGERRDIMLNAMKEHFPKEAQWTTPEGGLFLWVRTPKGVKSKDLLDIAIEEKVAFVPGYAFYTDSDGGQNGMRLNFSNSKPDQIREGIKRLGRAMVRIMG